MEKSHIQVANRRRLTISKIRSFELYVRGKTKREFFGVWQGNIKALLSAIKAFSVAVFGDPRPKALAPWLGPGLGSVVSLPNPTLP